MATRRRGTDRGERLPAAKANKPPGPHKAVRLTKENYKTIFENSAVAITVTDENERIVSWNKFAEVILGMDREDLYMKPVRSLYPVAEWRRIRSQNVRQKGIQNHIETSVIRNDQQIIDVDLSVTVLRSPDGRVTGSIGIMADITDRKKAERSLRESEERLSALIENAPDSITAYDFEGTILDSNRKGEELLGYRREEMIGRSMFDIGVIPEEYAAKTARALERAVESVEAKPFEFELVRKDGSRITAEVTTIAVERAGKAEIICISRDITERKKADEALRRSEEMSRGMIETAATGIYLMENSRITYVNRLMEEISGHTSEELIGTNPIDYVHPADRDMANAKAVESLKGDASLPYEFRAIRKDLEVVWVSERVVSVENSGHRAVLGTLMDITDRKKAEAEAQEYTKRIETLLNIGSTVGRTLNLSELLGSVLETVFAVMRIGAGGVFLIDAETKDLVLAAQRGFSSGFAQQVAKMRLGRGFAGRTALSGKPVIVGSATSDIRFDPVVLEREGLGSLCSVPIMARDEILGVMSVAGRDSYDFTEGDVRLLGSIANQVGMAIENAQLYEKTAEIAFTDDLTGLYNRRYFMEQTERELARAVRNGSPLSLVMVDMDGLKSINDRFGHHQGSEFLKDLGAMIRRNTRASDVPARLGGDEFAILAPDAGSGEAGEVGERLRAEVASDKKEIDGWEVGMSISVGIASYPDNASDVEELIRKADEAMYEAKRAGKNQVHVATAAAVSPRAAA